VLNAALYGYFLLISKVCMTAIFDERADDDDDPVQQKSCFYLSLDNRFHS